MKRLLLFIVSTVLCFSINAQDRYLKADAGIGSAMTLGKLKSYGISASIEPKFFFNPQFSLGVRLEGDVLFGGSINGTSEVNVGMSSRAATLLKGEYYLTEADNRMFIGLMAGRYVQANMGGGSSGAVSLSAGKYFGFAPEVGFTFKNFRISGIYHVVSGSDLVTISTGNAENVSRSYFVIQLGFKTFQLDF